MSQYSIDQLSSVAKTLLVPLACRAIESARPDAALHDPRAEQVYAALEGTPDLMMGIGKMDAFVMTLRARQFDTYAKGFLSRHPGGLVVDLGCGLDTRYDRLKDGSMTWMGVDLPQVIQLRRQLIPDEPGAQTLPQSMFDFSWMEAVQQTGKPAIFLAEGVFPYFSTAEIRPMVTEMARRFPQGELVMEAAAPFINRHHNRTSRVLKQTGTLIRWDAKNPEELETWGLCLLDRWYYFDNNEPRLRFYRWITLIPGMAKATGVFHYRLSRTP